MITFLLVGDVSIEAQWFHARSREELLEHVCRWIGSSADLHEWYGEMFEQLQGWSGWEPRAEPYEVYRDGGWCWMLLISDD